MTLSKKNVRSLKAQLKKNKARGGYYEEDQLVNLLLVAMKQTKNEELHSFANAITKGLLRGSETRLEME